MSSVFHLVYVSYASESLSYTDIRNILNSSRKNNARDDISGVLILREGYFLQVLEGDEAKIQALLNIIRRDNRNHTLKVLIEERSEKRLFGDWSMAFLDGDIEANTTKDLLDFFDVCLDSGITLIEFYREWRTFRRRISRLCLRSLRNIPIVRLL